MVERINKFCFEKKLIDSNDKLLLAVSGGIDSIVMLDVFSKLNYSCSIAHCNFGLRGEESDADEEFVKNLSLKYGIPIHNKRFETKIYSEENGISIQMAARDLRYEWFNELCLENNYSKIVLAHQQDDVIETFFINLFRGTGIAGLTGIKEKNGNLIRPLLFVSRAEIENYSIMNNLIFREDSSNIETKYIRNKIRHDILPIIRNINPNINKTMLDNIHRLSEVENILSANIENVFNDVVSIENDDYKIDIEGLFKLDNLDSYMYFFLKKFNFNKSEVEDVIESLNGISGKKFFSTTHRIVKDREKLIISKIDTAEKQKYYIEEDANEITIPINLLFKVFNKDESLIIEKSKNIAYLDFDKLNFPLVLRRWKEGEYFHPFGMKGLKKVSDFFIDQKMSIPEKERTWILSLGNEIVWIVGRRLDNRYKVDENTSRILKINYID